MSYKPIHHTYPYIKVQQRQTEQRACVRSLMSQLSASGPRRASLIGARPRTASLGHLSRLLPACSLHFGSRGCAYPPAAHPRPHIPSTPIAFTSALSSLISQTHLSGALVRRTLAHPTAHSYHRIRPPSLLHAPCSSDILLLPAPDCQRTISRRTSPRATRLRDASVAG